MAARRGRGIDFEHRFNTSRWAEELLLDALNARGTGLYCVRLGLSQVSEDGVPGEDDADVKEPDLLVFEREALTGRELELLEGTDLTGLRSAQIADRPKLMRLLQKACAAIEVEFSPYRAAEMKERHWRPKTPDELDRRPRKHAKPPTAPNIWIKLEDLPRLREWVRRFGLPVVVAHLFDQEAFAIDLRRIVAFDRSFRRSPAQQVRVQLLTGIFRKDQPYDRVDAQGAGERKTVFVVTPAAAIKVGDVRDVRVKAQLGLSASRKYVTHVVFEGGRLLLDAGFLSYLRALREE